MKAVWKSGGLAVAITTVANCALSADRPAAASCEVLDIQAVFSEPLAFDGQQFCGEGFWHGGDEYGGIYDRPVTSEDQRWDIAFLLIAGSGSSETLEIENGASVQVSGTIDSYACNPLDEVGDEGCTPVRRAIFLRDWRLRIAE